MDDWPDELQAMWENLGLIGAYDEEFPVETPDRAEWISHAEELFEIGWIDLGIDSEIRQQARDEFFDLMSEFDIDIDQFDWDEWRDWYDGAA